MTHNDSSHCPCREPGKKRGADLANKLAGANQIYRVSDDSFKNTPSVVGHIWTHEIGALALSPYIGRPFVSVLLEFRYRVCAIRSAFNKAWTTIYSTLDVLSGATLSPS